MSNETARPWKVHTYTEGKDTTYSIQPIHNVPHYPYLARSTGNNQKANAKLIVKAVNAYDELIAENAQLKAKGDMFDELVEWAKLELKNQRTASESVPDIPDYQVRIHMLETVLLVAKRLQAKELT